MFINAGEPEEMHEGNNQAMPEPVWTSSPATPDAEQVSGSSDMDVDGDTNLTIQPAHEYIAALPLTPAAGERKGRAVVCVCGLVVYVHVPLFLVRHCPYIIDGTCRSD